MTLCNRIAFSLVVGSWLSIGFLHARLRILDRRTQRVELALANEKAHRVEIRDGILRFLHPPAKPIPPEPWDMENLRRTGVVREPTAAQ